MQGCDIAIVTAPASVTYTYTVNQAPLTLSITDFATDISGCEPSLTYNIPVLDTNVFVFTQATTTSLGTI